MMVAYTSQQVMNPGIQFCNFIFIYVYFLQCMFLLSYFIGYVFSFVVVNEILNTSGYL